MRPLEIQKTFYKIGDFVSWSRSRTLVISPEFQRRSVWKADTKSYLIDTIIRGFPIPPIFLRDSGINLMSFEPNREVIDGQQRLRTVLAYIDPSLVENFNPQKDSFTVKSVHNTELAGKAFRELNIEQQRAILEYQFNVYVLSSYVDDREVIQIFRRMNSTNYTLNAQELRNATFYGEFKTSAYQLAAEQLHRWREWRLFTEDNISRMLEVELTSELLFFIVNGKIVRTTKKMMDGIYQRLDETYPQRYEVEVRFRNVMDIIADRFGRDILPNSNYKRSLFYGLFTYLYDAMYSLTSDLNEHLEPRPIEPHQIARIKLALERIELESAPERVIIAVRKSTTDTSSRQALFEYIRG